MQLYRRYIALAYAIVILSLVAPATAASPEVSRCKFGAYITSLQDVDTVKQTFSADAWIWTVCPNITMQPLQTAEFTTAQSVTAVLDSTFPRPTGYWSQRKISGTFRTDYDLTSFPFERHRLVIGIEEGEQDTSTFDYELDDLNSGLSPSIQLAQWKVDRFSPQRATPCTKRISATRSHHQTRRVGTVTSI